MITLYSKIVPIEAEKMSKQPHGCACYCYAHTDSWCCCWSHSEYAGSYYLHSQRRVSINATRWCHPVYFISAKNPCTSLVTWPQRDDITLSITWISVVNCVILHYDIISRNRNGCLNIERYNNELILDSKRVSFTCSKIVTKKETREEEFWEYVGRTVTFGAGGTARARTGTLIKSYSYVISLPNSTNTQCT